MHKYGIRPRTTRSLPSIRESCRRMRPHRTYRGPYRAILHPACFSFLEIKKWQQTIASYHTAFTRKANPPPRHATSLTPPPRPSAHPLSEATAVGPRRHVPTPTRILYGALDLRLRSAYIVVVSQTLSGVKQRHGYARV